MKFHITFRKKICSCLASDLQNILFAYVCMLEHLFAETSRPPIIMSGHVPTLKTLNLKFEKLKQNNINIIRIIKFALNMKHKLIIWLFLHCKLSSCKWRTEKQISYKIAAKHYKISLGLSILDILVSCRIDKMGLHFITNFLSRYKPSNNVFTLPKAFPNYYDPISTVLKIH